MKAIILAAGYATRMYPLTKDKPKALLPIGGKVMLDYLMDEVATIREIDTVYIVTNSRFAGQFSAWAEEAAARYPRLKLDVLDDGTDSNENRLGAVGDMRFVLDHRPVDDDLLVAASDNFFTFPLKDMVDDFRAHGRDTLLGQHLGWVEDLKRFAVATLDENARVTALVEKPQQPPTDIGIYALYLYKRETVPLIYQLSGRGQPARRPRPLPRMALQAQGSGRVPLRGRVHRHRHPAGVQGDLRALRQKIKWRASFPIAEGTRFFRAQFSRSIFFTARKSASTSSNVVSCPTLARTAPRSSVPRKRCAPGAQCSPPRTAMPSRAR